MPSLRVLSVVLLVGLGATAAGLAGSPPPETNSDVRAATASGTKPATKPATKTEPATEPATKPATKPGSQVRATTQHPGRSATDTADGFDVRAENALPGLKNWKITTTNGNAPGLGAYADAVSVPAGQRVALHISGSGPVLVRALRIGWYGGAGARRVWQTTIDATPASEQDPASWPALGFADTEDWPPGQYLLRLDLRAASRYIPLTVRSPQVAGRVLLVASPLTWEAENGPTPAGKLERSYDRPYAQAYGAGGFLANDASIIQLAERDGRRLAYTTDLDLALKPAAMDGATAIVFGSASTYWPADLRTSVIAAIEGGANAAFFGAGTGTRPVELSSDGRSMSVDSSVPAATTALTGLRPVCSPTAGSSAAGGASWVVQDAGWWGYADAAVAAGQALPGLVSAQPDGLTGPAGPAGSRVSVLAQSPVTCASGTPAATHAAEYWNDPSGAGVFTTGTGRWACVAGGSCGRGAPAVPASTRAMAAQVTRTVLMAFASAHAGQADSR